MNIGVCCSFEYAPIVKACGYDFVEENMSKIAELSENEFAERATQYEKLGMPVYSFNGFFRSHVSLYGENSLVAVCEYADSALIRAKQLGGEICVIGSGTARAIPDGISRDFAEKRFSDVVSICGDVADRYGIKIAIEPLYSKETNFINTVSQAADIAKMSGKRNVGALVDFFHFFMESESDNGIINNADTIIHAHIARPNADRLVPTTADVETVAHWAELLKKINYQGALSIEANFVGFESDIRKAMSCFKRLNLQRKKR